jgi:NADPH:quinone reductase-like Zn-dependent oxidoreductase
MRAFIVPEFGEPGSVGERPKPEPEEGQILVRVKAAGVNTMDAVIRAGYAKDWMEHRFPLTPGSDYAGTVEAIGPGVDGVSVGDEVFGANGKPYAGEGSFAEFIAAIADRSAKRPATVAPEAAAALPTAASTALAAVDALAANAGDTIAIIGAAGGVGGYTTQLATQRGLNVIAVTKGEHVDYVRGLGARDVIDYTTSEPLEQLRSKAPDGLAGIIDLYNDAQGAAPYASVVRPGGRIVSPIAMGLDKTLADGPVTGVMVRAATDRVGELAELAENGTLGVPFETVPLDAAAGALDRQASHQVRGKLVLVVD